MKFEYLPVVNALDSKGRMIKRPVLILELKTEDGNIWEVPAIVDSGADRTQANFEYAEMLGIALGPRGDSVGIGEGRVEGYLGVLPFKIRNTDIALEVPATYLKSGNVAVLLGREAFFDAFRIIFDQANNSFELIKKK
jgi:hypothetical protein